MTELFLVELEDAIDLSEVSYSGRFIVFEGISGSGKDTQARFLKKYLQGKGIEVEVVNHPTRFLKKIWRKWRSEVDDRYSELFLLLADRWRMFKDVVLPQLQKGKVVISTRSQISAQVYQKVERVSSEQYRFLFAFEPIADFYIYLDITAEEALRRADKRIKEGVEKDRGFFGKKQETQSKMYKEVLSNYPNVHRIDASSGIKEVAERIKKVIVTNLDFN